MVARQDLLSHPTLVGHQQRPLLLALAVEVRVPERPNVHAAQQVLQGAGEGVPGGVAVCALAAKREGLSGKDKKEKKKRKKPCLGSLVPRMEGA